MTVQYIGTTFSANTNWDPLAQWAHHEAQLVQNIQAQIQQHFPTSTNLLINTTWFGPQFNNTGYSDFLAMCSTQTFDNLFLLSSVDPICLNAEQIQQCKDLSGCTNLYLLGNSENQYQFNFISTLVPIYFKLYTPEEILPGKFEYIFLNYNRKPHTHRIELVDLLEQHNLLGCGVVTLGKRHTLPEDLLDKDLKIHMGPGRDLNIPHDVHTLGNIHVWRSHFLNIASETISFPWDPLFVTEKTWKPMIGLRPFVINGQTKIYQYLRDNKFKTFNHYWPHINIEHGDVHQGLIELIKFLKSLPLSELNAMYNDMLPDLHHNRDRFFEFAKEQQFKIENMFK